MKKVIREFVEKKKSVSTLKVRKQIDAVNLASKYLQLYESDQLQPAKYRNLMYGLNTISTILKNAWMDENEKRIQALENKEFPPIQIQLLDDSQIKCKGWAD